MSRSYKKTPIFGHAGCKSEKKDKRISNKAQRRKNKERLDSGEDTFLDKKEVMDIWDMSKDGKSYRNPKNMPNKKKDMGK
jgi:hypothetical protein